jgi:stage II sporulation protein D
MRRAAILLVLAAAACGARVAAPPLAPRGLLPPEREFAAQAIPTPPAPAQEPADEPPPAAAPLGREPAVRILLSRAASAGHAHVVVKGPWTLVSPEGATLRTGPSFDGDVVFSGAAATFPADSELRPKADGDLRVDARTYPGALRMERDGVRQRPMIATGIETYVAAVVNSEIPAAFPREAQRTQAILARTYALTSSVRTAPDAPLVLSDVGGVDQEFAGLAAVPEHRRIGLDAAQSTAGLVLTEGGAPFIAYYHSTCGGVTCPGTAVFGAKGAGRALAGGIVCPWCTTSRYFKWDAKIAGADVVKAAGLSGALESFSVAETTAGGRATSFDVKAGGRTRRVHAAEFRLRVGPAALRSVLLEEAAVADGDLAVKGRGWGHGVGLCQMGAKTMAEKGTTAEAILAFYYPGAFLERRW